MIHNLDKIWCINFMLKMTYILSRIYTNIPLPSEGTKHFFHLSQNSFFISIYIQSLPLSLSHTTFNCFLFSQSNFTSLQFLYQWNYIEYTPSHLASFIKKKKAFQVNSGNWVFQWFVYFLNLLSSMGYSTYLCTTNEHFSYITFRVIMYNIISNHMYAYF